MKQRHFDHEASYPQHVPDMTAQLPPPSHRPLSPECSQSVYLLALTVSLLALLFATAMSLVVPDKGEKESLVLLAESEDLAQSGGYHWHTVVEQVGALLC